MLNAGYNIRIPSGPRLYVLHVIPVYGPLHSVFDNTSFVIKYQTFDNINSSS